MKSTAVVDSSDILHKLETIEKELTTIKLSIIKKFTPTRKKVVSLKGIIKGVDITDDDIAFTQHSLYNKIEV
jgi:hypothetical protein